MSDKKSKSKSKSKSKQKDKPPKDSKSKKSKEEKAPKSKKGTQKSEKGSKKKSVVAPPSGPPPEMDLSQDNFSDFLKNPFSFPVTQGTDEALCVYHNQPTTVFCEISDQTGCEQCLVYGPLNTQMHRVIKIDEAFQARYLYLNDVVCGPLLQKRDELNKYLEQLTVLSDELRYVKTGVQKLTKVEFAEMLERLKSSSGHKFAILHREMADLQRDLQAINALGNQFFELTNLNPISPNPTDSTPKVIVPFLLRSKYLQEEAENLIAKPIKTSVDIYPYDLPRELTERKLILEKNKHWIELMKVKDEAIWTMTQEKKGLRAKLGQSLQQEAHSQIAEWQKLRDKIQAEIETYQMRCEKCGASLTGESVNEQCTQGGWHQFVPI